VSYNELRKRWQQNIDDDEREIQLHAGWTPMRLPQDPATVSVFGGTQLGWEALLTTLGGGLSGEGRYITVLNLSGRRVATTLEQLLKHFGLDPVRKVIGSVADAYGEEGSGAPGDCVSWIVRMLHERGGKEERLHAMMDRSLLEEVAQQLGGTLSAARLRLAIRVILGHEPSSAPHSSISPQEFDRLILLYPDEVRARTDVVARAHNLEQHLARLAAPSRTTSRSASFDALRVLDVDPTIGDEDFDEVGEALVELIADRWRNASDDALSHEAVTIVGASERIDLRVIESLATMAVRKRGRLILLFDRYRREMMEAAGLSDSSYAFMRLTDPREAAAAADALGREDKLVVASTTRQRGTAYEQGRSVTLGSSKGDSLSQTSSIFDVGSSTTSVQSGSSEAVADSQGRSDTVNESVTEELKTDELIIRPSEVQALPHTALLVIQCMHPRVVRSVDCDPNLVLLPHGRFPR
jgi:hypothetical protein